MSRSTTSFAPAEAAAAASAATGLTIQHEMTGGFSQALTAARFRLPNGLGILLMPDRRAPVFAYHTWFKVGSRDEDPSRTGLAHLFEHLMFKATGKHPAGSLDRELELRGSQTNAATWVDWTFYHESLAARGDNFATVVDFESDRMHNLILDEKTFRSEVEVVKNERRLSVDDSIGGALSEALYATAFETHPYRWPTIGAMAHLDAASISDLERFYRSYYAPNNATVVIVGDLDPVDVLTQVARAYGPIARQPIERRPRHPEPAQHGLRQVRLRRPVVAPQLLIGFHAVPQPDASFPALEVLNDALVGGDSARLYRRLVIQEEVATDVGGFPTPFADPGLYQVSVQARPGVAPDQIVELVQSELDVVRKEGLTDRELEKAKNGLELSTIDGFKDADGCAEALGHYETTWGDFRAAFHVVERVRNVGRADVLRVAQDILRPDNRTIAVVEPGSSGSVGEGAPS